MTDTSDFTPLLASRRHTVPISEFVIKIASRCNLACSYCYMYEMADQSWRSRPRLMADETVAAVAARIGEHARTRGLRNVTAVLHGGEPLLAGVRGLQHVAEALRKGLGSNTVLRLRVHTNGVLLNDEMLRMMHSQGIRVGVSIDGGPEHHDRSRQWRDGRGSYQAAAAALRLLAEPQNRELYSGLLCVVDTMNDPLDVYDELLRFAPPALDFLLPHGNWSAPPLGRGDGTTDIPYANWLITVFDRWYGSPKQETAVRLFQEIINLLLGGRSRTEQIGLSPVAFIVIDSDGSFQQADSLKSAYDGASDIGMNVFDHSVDTAIQHPAIQARQQGLEALGRTCRQCSVVRICGGGNYAHRYRSGHGFQQPSVYCPDLKRLISHIGARLRNDLSGADS